MSGADEESLEESALRKLGPAQTLPAEWRISRKDILRLRAMGYSMERIGKYFDVSRRTVYNVLGKMNWDELFSEGKEQARRYRKLIDEEGVN